MTAGIKAVFIDNKSDPNRRFEEVNRCDTVLNRFDSKFKQFCNCFNRLAVWKLSRLEAVTAGQLKLNLLGRFLV